MPDRSLCIVAFNSIILSATYQMVDGSLGRTMQAFLAWKLTPPMQVRQTQVMGMSDTIADTRHWVTEHKLKAIGMASQCACLGKQ